MELYYVKYIRGGIIWKTSPYMTDEAEAIKEARRFNSLPVSSLARSFMTARVGYIVIK